ncbi:MAG: glycosyltransferase family 1 protein [Deltaproteobacteria bacterium]|nr:MAG: glycosyltransferase family 1 protein [Deltaproteobacteria bacterium]
MDYCKYVGSSRNVGFISTRLAGTDGVSLETIKWADVFKKENFNCFYFAGDLDYPPKCSYLVEEAHFKHPEIRYIYSNCFGVRVRGRAITQNIQKIKRKLKTHIYNFIEKFDLDLLVLQNVLAIPLNIPLGIAIAEVLSESGMPAIAHHHDFFWEREHFKINAVWEYLGMAFPPHLPSLQHVVINSSAAHQLSIRRGVTGTLIPNVMDFENPPQVKDDYTTNVRKDLGIDDDELFILQPTRVVKRKGIEHAIELVRKLGIKAKLIISHASDDEGHDYEIRVKEYSRMLNVNTLFVSDIINECRGVTETGKKIYTLNDIYPHADLVTYPSNFEGFGNAFLEAVYYKKPIVVNTYSIYSMDIKPKGFYTIELNGYVTDGAVSMTRKVLRDAVFRKKMVDHNFNVARRYYSYDILHQKLRNIINDMTNTYPVWHT